MVRHFPLLKAATWQQHMHERDILGFPLSGIKWVTDLRPTVSVKHGKPKLDETEHD